MDKISLKAPAKINLFLKVLGKRPDGFHDIESLVQAIDLCDDITLEKSDIIEIVCDDPGIPSDETNLAYKAADVLQRSFYFPGVRIELKKRIPSQAGLGGGSSDAAFVLRGLCELYNLSPDVKDIISIAAEIGSDVPFFMSGGQALITGRGENVTAVHLPTDYKLVIVAPPYGFSTKEVYAKVKINLTEINTNHLLSTRISTSRFYRMISSFSNDLETAVSDKSSGPWDIKQLLVDNGAIYCAMSGSGSAIFGIFSEVDDVTSHLKSELDNSHKIFVCKPVLIKPF